MNNFFAYLRSKMFLKNLALAVALALGIFFVLLIYLRVYTHHGKSITVPDLSDLPVEDAGRILKERNLRYEIFDSLYVAARQAGVIIDQHPKAGKEVKKRRKVYFTINASSPEKILMPDLVGITLREASTKMQIAGLKTGKFIYRYNIGKNVVLEQLYNSKVIQANDTIVKGAVIDLVLGKGLSNEKSMVPDLIGLTKDQAIARAAEALFTIHSAIPDKSVKEDGELQPFVYRQDPIHHREVRVPLGKEIIIWITTDSTKLLTGEKQDSVPVWQSLNEADGEENPEEDPHDIDYN